MRKPTAAAIFCNGSRSHALSGQTSDNLRNYPTVIFTLPVSVSISHIPPEAERGTSTLPVSVSTSNILSESNEPSTSPVSVSINIFAASHRSRFTSPVLLSIKSFSAAITSIAAQRSTGPQPTEPLVRSQQMIMVLPRSRSTARKVP